MKFKNEDLSLKPEGVGITGAVDSQLIHHMHN